MAGISPSNNWVNTAVVFVTICTCVFVCMCVCVCVCVCQFCMKSTRVVFSIISAMLTSVCQQYYRWLKSDQTPVLPHVHIL